MPIYHVTGRGMVTGNPMGFYVEAEDVHEVYVFATRNAMRDASVTQIEGKLPMGIEIMRLQAPTKSGSVLLTHPKRTIALGVLFGMLLYTAIMFVIGLIAHG